LHPRAAGQAAGRGPRRRGHGRPPPRDRGPTLCRPWPSRGAENEPYRAPAPTGRRPRLRVIATRGVTGHRLDPAAASSARRLLRGNRPVDRRKSLRMKALRMRRKVILAVAVVLLAAVG